jgi:class 3 adenylate cyclase
MSDVPRRCEECGEDNPERARFCLACGAPLEVSREEERKLVSILFVDLVDFTARSDQADPEDVRDALEAYHRCAKERIEHFGGTVEKFIGDAVMAVFGAVSHGDDAERAVRAGLQVLTAIDGLGTDEPDLGLAARAAVNTGEAVVAVGRRAAGDAIAIGDVVNTAARLQSAAPPGRLIVGSETYRATRHAIAYEELPAVNAKGKSEPVRAWLAVEAFGPPAERAVTVSPMVGRDRELALLETIWEQAVGDRRLQAVTAIGPPGIGKSRLAREIAERVEHRGARVLRGKCQPYDEQTGYPAFGQVVKQVAGVFDTDPRPSPAARSTTSRRRCCRTRSRTRSPAISPSSSGWAPTSPPTSRSSSSTRRGASWSASGTSGRPSS